MNLASVLGSEEEAIARVAEHLLYQGFVPVTQWGIVRALTWPQWFAFRSSGERPN